MKTYYEYAKRLNEKAKEAFELYESAQKDLTRAEQIRKEYPLANGSTTAAYAAKSARAQADYLEARENLRAAQNALRARTSDFKALRDKLSADISEEFTANPQQLDTNTLELLKAGILKADEYSSFLNAALANNNHTMARLIGKYAAAAAENAAQIYGENGSEAVKLRAISYQSRTNAADEYMKAFDYLIDVYSRCANNPPMIEKWEELTGSVIEE